MLRAGVLVVGCGAVAAVACAHDLGWLGLVAIVVAMLIIDDVDDF